MDMSINGVPALQSSTASSRLEVPAGARAELLIVDDDATTRQILAAVLAGMGVDVYTADSGRAALRMLLKQDFAVILLDVHMPVMDGFETAQLIHSRQRSAHTPIIFVTAEMESESDRFRGYRYGAVDWITKPIEPEILQAKVKVFVDLFYLNSIAKRQAEELQQRSEEIARKNLQLEAASRMKSEFLASMSHELRTPLNAVIGFAEVLRDGLAGDLTGEQKVFVTDILESGEHLLSLINDILDLSKIESGHMTLDLEALDIVAVLSASVGMLREKAIKKGLHLDLSVMLKEPVETVYADLRKFKQMIYNLLSNAIKFTPEQGHVHITLRRVTRAAIRIDTSLDFTMRILPLPYNDFQSFIEVRVQDDGIGIAAAELPRLFQAFVQLDSSLAREYEGTGLGLALVLKMAVLHGGTVAVASGIGKGAVFVIWLPWRVRSDDSGGEASSVVDGTLASPPPLE